LVILSGLLFLLLCASPLRRSPIPLRRIDFGFPVPAEKEQGKNPAQSLKSKAKRAIRTPKAKTVKLLSGGNPQFAKGGAPPEHASITTIPVWKKPFGKRRHHDPAARDCRPTGDSSNQLNWVS
jgi:hypothetical protein